MYEIDIRHEFSCRRLEPASEGGCEFRFTAPENSGIGGKASTRRIPTIRLKSPATFVKTAVGPNPHGSLESNPFSYNIAHDLRSPTRMIAGLAEALLSSHSASLDQVGRNYLKRIAAVAQRTHALILDLLIHGQPAHTDLVCSKQSLRAHLDSAIQTFAAEINSTGASIHVANELPEVWADSAALQQIFTGLLSNALKFVSNGTRPLILIRAEDVGNAWRLLIQDNGIGIAPEDQPKVFGSLQQHHPNTEHKHNGSGTGLAMVQRSIERMGGKVGLSSSIGHGSCFWFELPKCPENAQ